MLIILWPTKENSRVYIASISGLASKLWSGLRVSLQLQVPAFMQLMPANYGQFLAKCR